MNERWLMLLVGSIVGSLQGLILYILGSIRSDLNKLVNKVDSHHENAAIHCKPDLMSILVADLKKSI